MTRPDIPARCPFCSSEKVYVLMNTLHCKRCKNMWKEDDPCTPPSAALIPPHDRPAPPPRRSGNLEDRMERTLEEHLRRSGGKFCTDTIAWKTGDISQALFRQYLKKCVRSGALSTERDRYGRTWYSGPR